MKVKWGALMVDGRNKIGGQVASKNRGGAYMRNKVTPVNPSTSFQTTVRNRLTTLSQNWRGLTAAQRNAWNSAVANFSRTDIFGDLKVPSGFNLYQRLNNNILALGGVVITSPPALTDLDQFSAVVLTYTSGTPALSLAFTVAAGTDGGYKLYATPPLSQGISFVKSEYRLIDADSTAPASPYNILTKYTAKFGSVGAVGTKIFIKIVPTGGVSGLEGTPIEVSTISAT
jgi:hypothetical protein